MPTAYVYSRYSSLAQSEGDSLRRQLKNSIEWAEARNLTVDTKTRDMGVSAYKGLNRIKGALGSFLRRVERGEIERGSYLIVDSLDRLSREGETVVINMLSGLVLAGIRVVNVSEDHVLDENATMVDYMRVLIHAMRANLESTEKGRKVAQAHAESKRRAREEGRIWHKAGPSWLEAVIEGEGRKRIIHRFDWIEERVVIVRIIYNLMDSGMGAAAIAQRFNDQIPPVPTFKHGKRWDHAAILSIAKNRAVLGEYQPKLCVGGNRAERRPNDGDAAPGYYGKPVIDEALFYRVQAKIAERNTRPGRGGGRNSKALNNLFTGLVKCQCGSTMAIHSPGSYSDGRVRKADLQCHVARLSPTECTHKARFPYAVFEAAVLANISDFDFTDRPLASPEELALQVALGQRATLVQSIDNLTDKIESGSSAVMRRLEQREAELVVKDREIADLKTKLSAHATKAPARAVQTALPPLLAKMTATEGDELYEVRARVSEAMRSLIEQATFRDNGTVRVALTAGLKAYIFDRAGELIGTEDIFAKMGERGVPPVAMIQNMFSRPGAAKLDDGAENVPNPSREAAIKRMASR